MYGIQIPSFTKSIAAHTSFARYVRHSLGFKAPRGLGWLTNPHRVLYNRIYHRTTFSLFHGGWILGLLFFLFMGSKSNEPMGPPSFWDGSWILGLIIKWLLLLVIVIGFCFTLYWLYYTHNAPNMWCSEMVDFGVPGHWLEKLFGAPKCIQGQGF